MNRYRTNRVVLLAAALTVVASGAEPPDDAGRGPSYWDAALAHLHSASSQGAALLAATDDRLRTARDSALAYLSEQVAAVPRRRGVHILAAPLCESEPTAEAPVEGTRESTLEWMPLGDASVSGHLTLLIHGLDEPGLVWDDLAPILRSAGHTVARFDYPNDQTIPASTAMLAAALRELKAAGVTQVNLVGHSKGGLIARDVLTHPDHYGSVGRGHDELPDIPRLITLGTPNHGSTWAHLQCISEAAEHLDRFMSDPNWNARHLLGFLADGRGEAASDLLPGSAYLQELNARPLPEGVKITAIVAVIDPAAPPGVAEATEGSGAEESPVAASFLSRQRLAELRRAASGRLGDGVVSTASARLEGVEDTIYIEASHRGMVRSSRLETAARWALRAPQDRPPAIPIIVDRLAPEPAQGR